jgi:hypothetical protein
VEAALPFAKQVIDSHFLAAQNAIKTIVGGSSNKIGKLK